MPATRLLTTTLLALAVVILAGAVFWFGFRSQAVRRGCVAETAVQLRDSELPVAERIDFYRLDYEFCLHRQGVAL